MRMLDFLHKAAAIKVFEFANSYGIRWQGFVQTLQAVVQFRKALLWYVLEPVFSAKEIIPHDNKTKIGDLK